MVAVVVLTSLPPPATAQSDEEKARSQLQELQRDIKRINREIASASARRNSLQKQLRQADLELGKLQRSLADNRRSLADNRSKLRALEQRRGTLEQSRERQQERIAAELRAAWKMGRQGQLRVLLSQESPHTVARAMGYHRHLFQARNELLVTYRDTLLELQALESDIATTMAQLETQQETLAREEAQVIKVQESRKIAVAQLNASIDSKGARLKKLEADRKELESLLQAIEEAVVNLQVPDNYQPFKSVRGKMPWPVPGKPSNRFGRPRNEGKMRWQGVTIPAKEGTPVRAIHHGRVVYADWFRGSGLLLIIDHGDGYMSLYAHNQTLLKDVGEWVAAGTTVSTVGNSGGQDRAALYFEIRHQGKPTDPARWCSG
jgi:septal ring factor EnvC (AmiA/AmiB activator)